MKENGVSRNQKSVHENRPVCLGKRVTYWNRCRPQNCIPRSKYSIDTLVCFLDTLACFPYRLF